MPDPTEEEYDHIIEDVNDEYCGSEANVVVQLRNIFPGIGGVIETQQPIVTALRKPFNQQPGLGRNLYLKHLLIKKLDDFFCRTGKYRFPHISRPLGSLDLITDEQEACIYEWIFGAETFPWDYRTGDGRHAIILAEWDIFVDAFENAGVKISTDVTDPDNGRISQNIIHELCRFSADGSKLNQCWKRIDFGAKSISFKQERLVSFLEKNSDLIKKVLNRSRYRLLWLAFRSIFEADSLSDSDLAELKALCRNYRLSSLRHATANIIIP